MNEPKGSSFLKQLPGTNPIRVAIVAGVGIVLALSAAITLAASPSPQGVGPGPNLPAGSPSTQRGPGVGYGAFGHGFGGPGKVGSAFGGGFGMGGFGMGGGFGVLGGATIAAIDGSSLSLKTADGWTRTIAVTSSTKISRGGQTVALSDLKVGDTIGFRESKATNGSFTIDAINVILPRVFGQVTATTATTITVKQFDGSTATIHVGSTTTFRIFGVDKATIASLKVGMTISAEGTKGTDGSLSALTVAGGQFRMPFQGGGHKAPVTAPSAAPGA